jgi:hypothetical protein
MELRELKGGKGLTVPQDPGAYAKDMSGVDPNVTQDDWRLARGASERRGPASSPVAKPRSVFTDPTDIPSLGWGLVNID